MREIGPHVLETYSVDEDSSDGEFGVEVADIITMEVFVENAHVEQGSGQGLAEPGLEPVEAEDNIAENEMIPPVYFSEDLSEDDETSGEVLTASELDISPGINVLMDQLEASDEVTRTTATTTTPSNLEETRAFFQYSVTSTNLITPSIDEDLSEMIFADEEVPLLRSIGEETLLDSQSSILGAADESNFESSSDFLDIQYDDMEISKEPAIGSIFSPELLELEVQSESVTQVSEVGGTKSKQPLFDIVAEDWLSDNEQDFTTEKTTIVTQSSTEAESVTVNPEGGLQNLEHSDQFMLDSTAITTPPSDLFPSVSQRSEVLTTSTPAEVSMHDNPTTNTDNDNKFSTESNEVKQEELITVTRNIDKAILTNKHEQDITTGTSLIEASDASGEDEDVEFSLNEGILESSFGGEEVDGSGLDEEGSYVTSSNREHKSIEKDSQFFDDLEISYVYQDDSYTPSTYTNTITTENSTIGNAGLKSNSSSAEVVSFTLLDSIDPNFDELIAFTPTGDPVSTLSSVVTTSTPMDLLTDIIISDEADGVTTKSSSYHFSTTAATATTHGNPGTEFVVEEDETSTRINFTQDSEDYAETLSTTAEAATSSATAARSTIAPTTASGSTSSGTTIDLTSQTIATITTSVDSQGSLARSTDVLIEEEEVDASESNKLDSSLKEEENRVEHMSPNIAQSVEETSNVTKVTMVKLQQGSQLLIQTFVDSGDFVNDITEDALRESVFSQDRRREDTFRSLMEIMNMWQVTQYAQLDTAVQANRIAKRIIIRDFRERMKQIFVQTNQDLAIESTKELLLVVNRRLQEEKSEVLEKILKRSAMILNEFFNKTKSALTKAVVQKPTRFKRTTEGFKSELTDYVRLVVDMLNIDVFNGLGKSLREVLGQIQCPVSVVNSTIVFTIANPLEELDKLQNMISGLPATSDATREMEEGLEGLNGNVTLNPIAVNVKPTDDVDEEATFKELLVSRPLRRLSSSDRGFGSSGDNVSSCETVGGRVSGHPCVFPFKLQEERLDTCVRRDRDRWDLDLSSYLVNLLLLYCVSCNPVQES